MFWTTEPESISKRLKDYKPAIIEHQKVLDEEQKRLIEEQNTYGDLVFLDGLQDTYSNLPEKLLKTIKLWAKCNFV